MSKVVERVNNINRLKRSLKAMKGAHVGYLKETTGPSKPYNNNITLATNAVIHEYGTKKIPPRPFMKGGVARFERKKSVIGTALKNVVIGKMSGKSGSQRIGVIMQSSIQNSIRNDKWTKLKPSTISRKGSSKPLIDTGALIQGVDAKIK